LQDPLWNKDTAFSYEERDRLGLRGLLPPVVRTIEEQVAVVMDHMDQEPTDVDKNMYLQDLANRNETLYYRTLVDNIEEMAPLVYTPTVGVVCQKFGDQYRRSRGMYFTRDDRGYMSTMVHNWPGDQIHVVVVTDGSRILGLGDLGAHGMGIPIGKLALYCAAGGVAPHRVLPVMLDVGTNNAALRGDRNYLGDRRQRLEGAAYYDMVDEFMRAIYARYPDCIVQFEDFETPKAVPLLARYRQRYRMFNDDIQGTGAVTVAGLLSACRAAGTALRDARVVCAGAGSAGLGVCEQIMLGMMEEGLSETEARSRFVMVTSKGALGRADGARGDPNHHRGLGPLKAPWVNPEVSDGTPLEELVEGFRPNVLLGLTTVPGTFSEAVLTSMGRVNERPIIMPMSNPTSKAECTPEEAYRCTGGRAVVATGSPFGPVTLDSQKKWRGESFTLIPSQCNNMYIFPGVGLAASISGVEVITDKMLYRAAQACAAAMTPEEIAEGRTFPRLRRIREVSRDVAVAVIEEGLAAGLCPKLRRKDVERPGGVPALVRAKMYFPIYAPLFHKPN